MDEGSIAWLGLATWLVLTWSATAVRALGDFSRSRLEEICRRRNRLDRFGEILRNDESTCLAMESFAVLAATALVLLAGRMLQSALAASDLAGVLYGFEVAAGLAAIAGVILAGILWVPRTLADLWGEPFIYHAWPLLSLLRQALIPIVALSRGWEKVAHRLAGRPEKPREGSFEAEIRTVFDEGEREGVLEEEAREMIESVIELGDASVSEIMTPRTDMVTIPVASTLEEARKIILEAGHSRVPVHGETRDDLIGILYAKDLLPYLVPEPVEQPRLGELVRKPLFIPQTKSVEDLLNEFQRQRVHMAVVLDEYGGVSGLVTIEDILEEIVGEIVDEYDKALQEPLVRLGPDVAEVDARMHVDEFNEALDLNLPEDGEFETVGGFVFSKLGRIPRVGEHFTYGTAHFTVLQAGVRKIDRLRVQVERESEGEQAQRVG